MARKRLKDDDEDDDDRPSRSRRRDDDEDDDDDRPRRRKRKTKAGFPKWAMVAIPLGVLFVCVIGYALSRRSKPAIPQLRPNEESNILMNSMKHIGLGVHIQHDVNGFFTGPYAIDDNKQPNPGLSWRVGMLPYIDANVAFLQFDRTKSWDSPVNQMFSNRKIQSYTSPDDFNAPGANTHMFGFNGPGAIMEANVKPPLTFMRITDGTSNTAVVADVTIGAPWASPTDVPYTRNGPLPSFGAAGSNTFLLLMADGSVRTMKKSISPAVMHLLIQVADGQVVNLDGL